MHSNLPSIEVIIPVHSSERPIWRAVRSIIVSQHSNVSALVVSHNISRDRILANLEGLDADRYRVMEHYDGFASPAGPRNAGIREAKADYVAFLDSDDEYEPGALDNWSTELGSLRLPDLLICQMKSSSAGRILAPLPRIGRFSSLDPVKDLLNNRTAPVGSLIKREILQSSDCPQFTENCSIGEDIELGLYLWNLLPNIAYSRHEAGYFIHEDGGDRVTKNTPALEEALKPVLAPVEEAWFRSLPIRQRQAICIKLIRFQVLSLCIRLADENTLSKSDLGAASLAAQKLLTAAPGARGYLTISEARNVDRLLATPPIPPISSSRFQPMSLIGKLVPNQLRHLLSPTSGLRVALRLAIVPCTLRGTLAKVN